MSITRTTTIAIDDADETSVALSSVDTTPHYPDPEWSHTTLNYYRDADAPPPDTVNSQLTEHEMRLVRRSDTSPHIAPTAVSIRNIRGQEHAYSIAGQGFTIARLASRMPPGVQQWRDDELLKAVFFPEIDALLKRELGCTTTFQYEWHVRGATLEDALAAPSTAGKVDIDGPVRRVHIDESPASARREFAHYHPELKGATFGIFNVWKPLKTVRRDPLCLCDETSLRDEELQAGKVTVPNVGEIENFAVRPPAEGRGAHRFGYLRDMGVEEAYVFRIYDGRVDDDGGGEREGRGRKRSHGVAHTSFVDPGTERKEARESVEVRSFCVF